jgi:hypothetical protein
MEKDSGSIQLKLTPEQQEQVRQATGKMADTLELSFKNWSSALGRLESCSAEV